MAHKLKITIKGSDPKIYRMVIVPENFTFYQLHLIIQCAFNWSDYHLYQFYLGRMYDSDSVSSPDDEDFDDEDFDDEDFGDEDFGDDFNFRRHNNYNAQKTKLAELLREDLKKFYYLYDFGDNWVHEITVLKKPSEEVLFPICIKGENIAPAEDCGGIYGFYDMLESLKNPDSQEEKEDLEEWLGLSSGQKFEEAYVFDLKKINADLVSTFKK